MMSVLMFILSGVSFILGTLLIGEIRSDIQLGIIFSIYLSGFIFLGLASILQKLKDPKK